MKLVFFRSLWGIPIHTDSSSSSSPPDLYWDSILSLVQKSGFDGIEASLGDLGLLLNSNHVDMQMRIPPPFNPLLLHKYSLKIILGIYTCWQDYEEDNDDDFQGATLESTLKTYKSQLEIVRAIFNTNTNSASSVFRINVHSGCDYWDLETSTCFFKGAAEIEKELGFNIDSNLISHETHRSRILSTPWTTHRLIKQNLSLNLTLDASHWIIGMEVEIANQKI